MKIIQLIYSLCSGGAERFVVSLSNQLTEMGHDVTVCMLLSDQNDSYVFNRQFLDSRVRFHSMGYLPGFSLKKVIDVEKYILSHQPDVVHCHLNVIPYVFRLAITQRDIRFIHTLHNVAENASGKKWQKFINRFFYKHRYITPITISARCRQSYRDYYGLPSPVSIDNGCEVPRKSIRFDEVVSEVESYKDNPNSPVFIHVARFHEQKNQNLLIDAFNELDRKGEDFVLLVIGDGFHQGPGAELKRRACAKIHFLGLKNNVADYLYCSDAFCLTSIYEGLPISLLEAMACGVVPICTNVGGIPDVVSDGCTGYLAELQIADYCRAIELFMKYRLNPKWVVEHFVTYFSMDNCAQKYIQVYSIRK